VKRFDAAIALDVVSMPGEKEGSIACDHLFRQKFLINLHHRVKRFDDTRGGLLP
jgi:hypothetical protein